MIAAGGTPLVSLGSDTIAVLRIGFRFLVDSLGTANPGSMPPLASISKPSHTKRFKSSYDQPYQRFSAPSAIPDKCVGNNFAGR